MPAVEAGGAGRAGKLRDLTGPGLTDRFGMTCTDLGASVRAADGGLVSVFGDTFSGDAVGAGRWRSPVILIGSGDAARPIVYRRAAGPDPGYAHQLWHYRHRHDAGMLRRGISTVIPSDLLRVDDTLYLHVIVNRGFGNVAWTEIWGSQDNGVSWRHLGPSAKFPAGLHGGHAQCWSWDYDPGDGWVYVASTGFQRDKGVILRRVRPEDIGRRSRYLAWDGRRWGRRAAVLTPPGERWGELSLRRLDCGTWVLGGFLASEYSLGYRALGSLTADYGDVAVQRPVRGCSWDAEDHGRCRVAQLYGGYVLPGSRLDVPGGVGLVVSQWNTARGWPYKVMQFRVTLSADCAFSYANRR